MTLVLMAETCPQVCIVDSERSGYGQYAMGLYDLRRVALQQVASGYSK